MVDMVHSSATPAFATLRHPLAGGGMSLSNNHINNKEA